MVAAPAEANLANLQPQPQEGLQVSEANAPMFAPQQVLYSQPAACVQHTVYTNPQSADSGMTYLQHPVYQYNTPTTYGTPATVQSCRYVVPSVSAPAMTYQAAPATTYQPTTLIPTAARQVQAVPQYVTPAYQAEVPYPAVPSGYATASSTTTYATPYPTPLYNDQQVFLAPNTGSYAFHPSVAGNSNDEVAATLQTAASMVAMPGAGGVAFPSAASMVATQQFHFYPSEPNVADQVIENINAIGGVWTAPAPTAEVQTAHAQDTAEQNETGKDGTRSSPSRQTKKKISSSKKKSAACC